MRLYRIVKTDPPTLQDFLSHRALGIPLRHPTSRALRLWDGVSVHRTREQAAALTAVSPRLGQYIAELRVTDGVGVRYELDNGKNGHCTVWAEPDVLLGLVVAVTPA
jgi:hypothetical protein